MPKSSNVRSKTPRPLAGDGGAQDHGLTHAYRWGTLRNSAPPPLPTRSRDVTPTPPPVAVAVERPVDRAATPVRPGRNTAAPPTPRDFEVPVDVLESARPWWQRWAVGAFAVAAVVGLVAVLRQTRHVEVAQGSLVAQIETQAALPPEPAAPTSSAAPLLAKDSQPTMSAPPSDAPSKPGALSVTYDGHVPIDGGVLHLPSTFRPRDGGYDLVIHFHGDVRIVRESVERANVNAALAIVNWGIRSVPYRDIYKEGGRFERLLAQIQGGIGQRGFKNLELRRMALMAWSGGYGAIESILETRLAPNAENDPLDAIILLDGIHAGFVDDDPNRISEISVLPFLRAAKAAANNRILFTLTHSEIDPIVYASTKRSAELLLTSVGAKPEKAAINAPKHLKLKAAQMSIGRDQNLEPTTDTRVGSLHITGYRGITPEVHAAHLIQMASIALPELSQRWAQPAPARVHPVVTDDGTDRSTDRKLPAGNAVLPPPSQLPSNRTASPRTAAVTLPGKGPVKAGASTPSRHN